MADTDSKEVSLTPSGLQRVDEFYTDYANNVYLESSFWDLKLIFGQLDQSISPPITEQSGAVTIPWTQAKIFNYLLTAHIQWHEMANGPIVLSAAVLPPLPTPPNEEAKKQDPNVQKFYEYMLKLREQFFANAKTTT
jgi:hypothetical protein